MTAWSTATVLGFPVDVVLWLFFLHSCAGVVVEGVFCLVTTRRLELRLGLLYLPLRPLYGVGGAACTVLLTPLLDHPVAVFVLSALICSVVEYGAGWLLETAFGTTSWDYGDKRLNLHGRICLQFSLAWGVLATAALYASRPLVEEALRPGPRPYGTLLAVLVVATLLSAVLTVAALTRVRRRLDAHAAPTRDATAGRVPARWERVVDRLVPDPVLVHSFPAMGLSAELQQLTRTRRTAEVTAPRPAAVAGRRPVDVLRHDAGRG